MNPIAVDGPAVEPISLADMKSYLRLDGDDEDDLVSALIVAGRLAVEQAGRIALISQTWRLRLAAWPGDRVVALPFRPFVSVEAIRVADGGTSPPSPVSSDLYRVDAASDPVRLLLDATIPAPARRSAGIQIDVVCGFGASAAAVPEPLRLAVRRLAAYWFERRGDEMPRRSPGLPADVLALVAPFAAPRLA